MSWPKVTVISEILQPMKKLKSPDLGFLLTPRSLEPPLVDCTDMVSTERLLLSRLFNICTKLSTDGGAVMVDFLDEDGFSLELMVTGTDFITIST